MHLVIAKKKKIKKGKISKSVILTSLVVLALNFSAIKQSNQMKHRFQCVNVCTVR